MIRTSYTCTLCLQVALEVDSALDMLTLGSSDPHRPPQRPAGGTAEEIAVPEGGVAASAGGAAVLAGGAEGSGVTAVLIRTHLRDGRAAVSEVWLPVGPHLLGAIASALLPSSTSSPSGKAPTHASAPTQVPVSGSAARPGAAEAAELAGGLLCWGPVGVKWPLLAPVASPAPVPDSTSARAEEVSRQRGSGEGQLPIFYAETQDPPFMYSLMNSAGTGSFSASEQPLSPPFTVSEHPLNELASWLAGEPVSGDVLLTTCRPRNQRSE